MKTIEQWMNRNLRASSPPRVVLNGEPLEIGKEMFLVEYRNGQSAKVKQFAVVQPTEDGADWRYVGTVRGLHGYREGQYEANTNWVKPGTTPGQYFELTARCPSQIEAVEMLVRFCQTMRP